MIIVAIVCLFVALLFYLYQKQHDATRRLLHWQSKAEERISTIEVGNQNREVRHGRVVAFIKRLRRDVNAIGRDVGWEDNHHKTQVIKKQDPPPPDDSNP